MPGTHEATQQMASIIIIQIQPIKMEMLTGLPERRALCKHMRLSDSAHPWLRVEKS